MLQRFRDARLVWPTLAAALVLAVLVGLGTWQLQRKAWKEGLIAAIAARSHGEPVPLDAAAAAHSAGQGEYLHVAAEGRFLHDKERYLYAPAPGQLGWHVYTPLDTGDGRHVWVNRGLVPDTRKAPATRTEGQILGVVRVTGLLRGVPARNMFTPENDVAANQWYWPDLPAMTASAFGSGERAMPFAIEVDAVPAPAGGLPRGGVTRLALPNRHLEYAVTWYGLGITLIGVYFTFVWGRLRS